MSKLEAAPCNNIFEQIYDEERSDQVTFRSERGIFVVLARDQATEGHSLVVPTECVPSLALLSSHARRKVSIVRAATKLWLQAAFDPEYVGGLDAGKEVRHAHAHEAPCSNRDFYAVMGAPNPQPFVEMDKDRAAEVFAAATFHPIYAAAVETELEKEGSVPPLHLQEMAYDLAPRGTPRSA